LRQGHRRKRIGVSEVMGSLIMIAITLIAGTAAFGFVNGQTGSAAGQIGSGVGSNVNFLREKEAIALVNFDNNTGLSVYVYNNGAETLQVASLIIVGPTCPSGSGTNCPIAQVPSVLNMQGAVTLVCSATTCIVTGTSTGSPLTTATCTTTASAGLNSIGISKFVRTSIKLTGCNFAFAASPSLPALTAPPLTNSFKVEVVGQYGSSATVIVTR
jgi:flagellin-like protein